MSGPIHLLVPGPLDTPTGGFIYDRHMVEGLARQRRLGGVLRIDGAFPSPTSEEVAAAVAPLAQVPDGAGLVIDGLALTALIDEVRPHVGRLRLLALVHHPLADETGVDPARRAALFEAERAALAAMDGVVVTSRTTAARLADFGVPADRLQVVVPGTDRPVIEAVGASPVAASSPARRPPEPQPAASGFPRRREFPSSAVVKGIIPGPRKRQRDGERRTERGGRPRAETVRLLCVGSLVPRKGQDLLVEALAGLGALNWHLDLIGGERDAAFAGRVRGLVETHGLAERVTFAGAVADEALERAYAEADLFVLPSHHEGYGMAIGEALRRGLPIVTSRAGAIPEVVGDGAMLLPPGDVNALSTALARLMSRADERRRLGEAAARAGAALPDWRQSEDAFLVAVDRLAWP